MNATCSTASLLWARLVQEVDRIDDCYECVEPDARLYVISDEECRSDGCRIGEPGRFDQNAIERACALLQATQRLYQIPANRAAETAIVELDELSLLIMDDELSVDTDLTKFVDYNSEPAAMPLTQNAVDQRRFARAKKARHDGRGNAAVSGCRTRARWFGVGPVGLLRWLRADKDESSRRSRSRFRAGLDHQPRSCAYACAISPSGCFLGASPPGVATTVFVIAAMPCSRMTLRFGGGSLSPRS